MQTACRLEPILFSWVHARLCHKLLTRFSSSSTNSEGRSIVDSGFLGDKASNLSQERTFGTAETEERFCSEMSGTEGNGGASESQSIFGQNRLGVGTWQWGDKTWNYKGEESEKQAQEAFLKSIECGVYLFDTATVYGNGKSETLIGKFLQLAPAESKEKLIVATKYVPLPFHLNPRKKMVSTLKESLKRLQLEKVELFQIHGPAFSTRSIEHLAEGLADAYDAGLCKAVGVSNFSADHVRRAHSTLLKRNIKLQSNQVEFSLLRLLPEENGLFKTCSDLGVTVLAYSPLAQGRLTGKYSAANPPPSGRRFGNVKMEELVPLLEKMKEIAEAHGKTQSQVALNWIISKGAIPIPGAKNAKQAEDNAGALGWQLTSDEVDQLSQLGKKGKNDFWQQG